MHAEECDRHIPLYNIQSAFVVDINTIDCKTAVFFVNTSDGPYSNERSGASVKTARENGERHKDHAYSASRLTKTSENDCFAAY